MLILLLTQLAAGGTCSDLVERLDAPGRCLTVALLSTAEEARERGCEVELEEALRARGLRPVGPRTAAAAPPPGDVEKAERDYWNESYPHTHATENFVIKWGDETRFDAGHARALGQAFEHAWDVEVGEWGFPPPARSDAWLLNVYIGDSGDGTPSAYNNAGYFTRDPEGFPYIVIASMIASSSEDHRFTASHEFFHSLQDASETFGHGRQAAWFWEATAVWSEEEIFPEELAASDFLPSWAFLPEAPINAFDWDDEGWYGISRQYGAFLFPRWLTERYGGRELMRRLWVESPPDEDPLRVIDDLLVAEAETDVEQAFFGFLDAAATWDFERAEAYEEIMHDHGGWEASSSHRPVGTLRGSTDGWRQPSYFDPYTYGAGYWQVFSNPYGVVLDFEALSDARAWHVAVAWREGDAHRVAPVEVVDGVGSLDLQGLDAEGVDDIWIVVGVVDGYRDYGDTYPYRFKWTEYDPPLDTGEGEAPRACGCGHGGPWAWWLALLPLLALRRGPRRRG